MVGIVFDDHSEKISDERLLRGVTATSPIALCGTFPIAANYFAALNGLLPLAASKAR